MEKTGEICAGCGKPMTTWDEKVRKARGARLMLCENCIADAEGFTVAMLRQKLWQQNGLLPCPELIPGYQSEVD